MPERPGVVVPEDQRNAGIDRDDQRQRCGPGPEPRRRAGAVRPRTERRVSTWGDSRRPATMFDPRRQGAFGPDEVPPGGADAISVAWRTRRSARSPPRIRQPRRPGRSGSGYARDWFRAPPAQESFGEHGDVLRCVQVARERGVVAGRLCPQIERGLRHRARAGPARAAVEAR